MMRCLEVALSVLVTLASVDAAAVDTDVAPLLLSATPSEFFLGLTEDLVLDCRAGPSLLDDVHMDMILSLFHDDNNGTVTPVAKQIVGNTILIAVNNRTTAVGESNGLEDSNDSYLTVTISNPGVSDAGLYKCNFEYFNDDFGRQEFSSSANVTYSEVPENVTEVFIPEPENTTCCCCAELKEEIAELRASLMSENIWLKEQLAQKREGPAPAPATYDGTCNSAFTARLTSVGGDEYGPEFQDGMTLYFDDVINNAGVAYDGTEGKFTAPCPGQYLFSLTLRAYQNYDAGSVSGVITKNGEAQARTFTYYDHDSYNDASSSVSVTLTLAEGDEVAVTLETTSSGHLGAAEYSVFTGLFLGA